jgi:hypothetical protein
MDMLVPSLAARIQVVTKSSGGEFMMLLRYFFLVATLVFFAGISTAGAVSSITISPDGGSTSTYSLNGVNIRDAASVDVSFSYDTTTLSGPVVNISPSLAGVMMEANTSTPGFVRIVFLTSAFKNDGQLATIAFTKVGDLPGRLYDARINSVYSPSGTQIAAQASIGPGSSTTNTTNTTSTASTTNPTSQISQISQTNTGGSTNSSNKGGMSTVFDQAEKQILQRQLQQIQQSGMENGELKYPDELAQTQQNTGTIQFDQGRPDQRRVDIRKDEQKAEAPAEVAKSTTQPAPAEPAYSSVAESDKNAAAPAKALSRLMSIETPIQRFLNFKGVRTLKNLAALFDVQKAVAAGLNQTPAIAMSDGKSRFTVKLELAASGVTPNFTFKGANLKSIMPVSETAWELGALPQKGKLDVQLAILVGNEQVVLPLVVVPPLDAAVLKEAQGLSEAGVDAMLAKVDVKATKPVYDLNADGKQDLLDDYILVAHYLLNKQKLENNVTQK